MDATRAELAAMLGLDEADVAPTPRRRPLWIDTGAEQLVIPLASAAAVAAPRRAPDRCCATGTPASAHGLRLRARQRDPATGGRAGNRPRFFFPKHGAAVEDPGTGSACANLGGWLIATSASLPQRIASHRVTRSADRAGWGSRSPPNAGYASRGAWSRSRAGRSRFRAGAHGVRACERLNKGRLGRHTGRPVTAGYRLPGLWCQQEFRSVRWKQRGRSTPTAPVTKANWRTSLCEGRPVPRPYAPAGRRRRHPPGLRRSRR